VSSIVGPTSHIPSNEIIITQGVEIGRPSTLHARLETRGGQVERIEVGSSAVIVGQAELSL
jgi:predicted PhzF superfamily epimerase YddE/YHI9